MGKMTDFRGEKRQSDDRSVQSEDGEGEQELPSRRPGEPRGGTAPWHPSAAAGPPGTPSPLPFHLISFCLSGAGGCCSGWLCLGRAEAPAQSLAGSAQQLQRRKTLAEPQRQRQ